ncbi:hypothetical protein C8N36_11414 [Pelagimonas varians]|uniref:Uncharacterized protein n=1 Tax=Pelagimonas varians TaxID=696760 RepID=A0A238KWX5_9RHOB|nr:hypothetical protein C8N36_11414 [Pelagimonas varians]SMX47334.1 hypothetical protein PEV8663_03513 [Pelagimonas varians]
MRDPGRRKGSVMLCGLLPELGGGGIWEEKRYRRRSRKRQGGGEPLAAFYV